MELKFIYVHNYGIVQNLNINFNHTGDHQFFYQTGKLETIENEKSFLKFGEKISSVTVLAGKNGSGKSSICEVLLASLATYTEGSFGKNFNFIGIVCFNDFIFYQEDLAPNNRTDLEKLGYRIFSFKESPFEHMKGTWKKDVVQSSFIYYSNILDIRSGLDENNLRNISTQFLLQQSYRTTTKFLDNISLFKVPELTVYRLEESYKIMKLLLEKEDVIPFAVPKYFILKNSYSKSNRYLEMQDHIGKDLRLFCNELESEILDGVAPFKKEYSDFETKIPLKAKTVRNTCKLLYRLNFVRALLNIKSVDLNEEDIRAFLYNHKTSNRSLQPYLLSMQNYDALVDLADIQDDTIQPAYLQEQDINVFDWRFTQIENLYIPTTNNSKQLLGSLFSSENSLFAISQLQYGRISDYSFYPYYSSGELSLLTLFSRLYSTILEIERDDIAHQNILLFLDEAEVGFHPEWKKKYFKKLVDFLNALKIDFKFQLILTTHSPYLLSDLPSSNVILLDRSEHGNTKIVSQEKFSTFGANIHELLANTFFLTDGTIGEFAKEKIQTVITRLNSLISLKGNDRDYIISKEEGDELFSFISLIGDSIVKNKLLEMHYMVFNSLESIDNEIDDLEKRLAALKKVRDDRN